MPDEAIISTHPELMPELEQKLRDLHGVEEAALEARMEAESTAIARLPAQAIHGYTLQCEIHGGGQGVVYSAIQKSTDRKVAIKVMHQGPFHGLYERARFDREVRLLARLRHPNIVTIFDSGIASGSHYFVMDYIDGRALNHGSVAGMSLRAKLTVFLQVCEAVHAAHLQGIIHRDLKPNNIHITADGRPHIFDFGLARVVVENEEITRSRAITVTGQFVGSLPWASPEQAQGDSSRIDVRTDVYSLGVVLYELFTGQLPYNVTGGMREALANIMEADPIRPRSICRDIDDELETIVLKCLSKDRDRRYQSAGELARDIRRYLANEPIEAKRESTLYILRKQARKHRWPLATAATVIILVAAAAIMGWTLYLRSQRNLWDSYLAHAQAVRATQTPGRRFDALETLAKAAAIHPSIELRNEAIAAMALADFRITKRIEPQYPTQTTPQFRFSPNGELFWIGSVSSGEISLRRFKDNRTLITAAALPGTWSGFSPDSRRIAIATPSGCDIWDIEHAVVTDRIVTHVSDRANPFAFSADGRALAIANKDGSILIHSLEGDEDRVLPALGRPILWIAYDTMGERIAASFLGQNEVVIRNARNGDLVHRLEHPASAWQMAWSPDGRQLAVGCSDTNVHLWDTETGVRQFTLRGHDGTVARLGYNSSGDMLFSSDWLGVSRLWDPRRGVALLALPGMGANVFAPGSNHLRVHDWVSGHLALRAAEVVYGNSLRTVVGHPISEPNVTSKSIAISSDGSLAVTCSGTGFRIWNLKTGEQVCRVPLGRRVQAAFAPDGPALFTVTGRDVWRWPIEVDANVRRIGPPVLLFQGAWEDSAEACCISPDGKSLYVTSSERDHALVFDTTGQGKPRRIGSHPGFRYISISHDGRWLASGSWGGIGAKVWNGESGALVHDFPFDDSVNVDFSPDGRWLVTSEAEHIVWEAGTWQPVARFPRSDFRSVPGPITFSHDGKLLAVRGVGSSIELIDLTKMKFIARLACPDMSGVEYLTFTPDGTGLVFPHPKRADILYVWDLREVRKQLAAINLDWDLPPYPPAPELPASPPNVEVDLGDLAPASESSTE